jgi:hypothetical protein
VTDFAARPAVVRPGRLTLQAVWPPVALFLFAVGLRGVAALATGFDGLYGQDPFAYYSYSLELRQALGNLQPPPPFFWPIGYPLLVVIASLVAGTGPFAGQLVSLLTGALVGPLAFFLVKEIEPEARFGAFVAGLLAATSAQMTISSLSVMADAAGVAGATFSAWAMLRYLNRLEERWLALSAFALGWAVLCRWGYALAVLPWALAALLAWRDQRMPLAKALRSVVLAVAAGGLVLGSQFVFDLDNRDFSYTGDLEVYLEDVGWDLGNAFKSTIVNTDGLFEYERPIGLYYGLPAAHPAFITPFFAPFLLAGLLLLARRRTPVALLLIGWPFTVYLFLAGIAWQNPRFSLAFFPPLLVLVALGLHWASRRFRPPWRALLLAWCAAGLLFSAAWMARDLGQFVERTKRDLDTARWLAANVPAGATVITFSITLTLDHYTPLQVEEIYNLDEAELQALLARRPLYLFLDVANVERQWRGKSPQLNYAWLQQHVRLRPAGSFPPYDLFEITP